MGAGTMLVFNHYVKSGLPNALPYAQTMAFTTLVMFEMFAVMSARSFSSFRKINPFSNKPLTIGILISVIVQIIVIYWKPMQNIFGTVSINIGDWIFLLIVSSLGFALMELGKLLIKEEYVIIKNTQKEI